LKCTQTAVINTMLANMGSRAKRCGLCIAVFGSYHV
jgi:hypothetical protein